jgi:hypothetical protein
MSTLRTAAQQALNALSCIEYSFCGITDGPSEDTTEAVITTLRAALAEPEPFSPDWDRIEPLQENLREHMAEIQRLRSELALQRFTDVNQEIEAALAEPVPVAWMHVPYPGNAISPMLSLSKHREPSIYAASVPLYIKEQP